MDYSKWTELAIEQINELDEGCIFELKKLFEGVLWEQLPMGDRRNFGKFFKNEVQDGRIKNIIILERGKNNHSRYQKKKEGEEQ